MTDTRVTSKLNQLRAVFILLMITQLIALILASRFDLTDTEAYYWTWSLKPDFGYFDHPPMLSWVIAGFTSLFGHSSFVIRLPALIGKLITCAIFIYLLKKN